MVRRWFGPGAYSASRTPRRASEYTGRHLGVPTMEDRRKKDRLGSFLLLVVLCKNAKAGGLGICKFDTLVSGIVNRVLLRVAGEKPCPALERP